MNVKHGKSLSANVNACFIGFDMSFVLYMYIYIPKNPYKY